MLPAVREEWKFRAQALRLPPRQELMRLLYLSFPIWFQSNLTVTSATACESNLLPQAPHPINDAIHASPQFEKLFSRAQALRSHVATA